MTAIVELSQATLQPLGTAGLKGLDLVVEPGQSVKVTAPSGQGKSLLLEVLAGRHRLTSGTRRYPAFEDQYPDARLGWAPRFTVRLVGSREQRLLSTSNAGFYQARWHSLFTSPLTVQEFLAPRRVLGLHDYEVLEHLPIREDYPGALAAVVADFELEPLLGRRVAQLSNGELKKLLIAAAYLANPRLLLLDDPLGGLSSTAQQALAATLTRWTRDGAAVVFSTAHEDELASVATRHLRLFGGQLTAHEPAVPTRPLALAPTTSSAVTATNAAPSPLATDARPEDTEDWVLRCRDARVVLDGQALLTDVTWSVRPGEHWLVTGHNGSGKTTLLALLTGDQPQSYAADVEVLGTRLGRDANLSDRRQKLGYVAPELAWHYPRDYSLRELVLSGFGATVGIHRPSLEVEHLRAEQLLQQFGLLSSAERPLSILSEGHVRLGLILRALVHAPRLLLLDEPTQELGTEERRAVLEALDVVAYGGGCTVILVTHHRDERPRCITHELRLKRGAVEAQGRLT